MTLLDIGHTITERHGQRQPITGSDISQWHKASPGTFVQGQSPGVGGRFPNEAAFLQLLDHLNGHESLFRTELRGAKNDQLWQTLLQYELEKNKPDIIIACLAIIVIRQVIGGWIQYPVEGGVVVTLGAQQLQLQYTKDVETIFNDHFLLKIVPSALQEPPTAALPANVVLISWVNGDGEHIGTWRFAFDSRRTTNQFWGMLHLFP